MSGPGQAPSFRGIPDGSVEFQLLLELVEDAGHSRNLEMKGTFPGSDRKTHGLV